VEEQRRCCPLRVQRCEAAPEIWEKVRTPPEWNAASPFTVKVTSASAETHRTASDCRTDRRDVFACRFIPCRFTVRSNLRVVRRVRVRAFYGSGLDRLASECCSEQVRVVSATPGRVRVREADHPGVRGQNHQFC